MASEKPKNILTMQERNERIRDQLRNERGQPKRETARTQAPEMRTVIDEAIQSLLNVLEKKSLYSPELSTQLAQSLAGLINEEEKICTDLEDVEIKKEGLIEYENQPKEELSEEEWEAYLANHKAMDCRVPVAEVFVEPHRESHIDEEIARYNTKLDELAGIVADNTSVAMRNSCMIGIELRAAQLLRAKIAQFFQNNSVGEACLATLEEIKKNTDIYRTRKKAMLSLYVQKMFSIPRRQMFSLISAKVQKIFFLSLQEEPEQLQTEFNQLVWIIQKIQKKYPKYKTRIKELREYYKEHTQTFPTEIRSKILSLLHDEDKKVVEAAAPRQKRKKRVHVDVPFSVASAAVAAAPPLSEASDAQPSVVELAPITVKPFYPSRAIIFPKRFRQSFTSTSPLARNNIVYNRIAADLLRDELGQLRAKGVAPAVYFEILEKIKTNTGVNSSIKKGMSLYYVKEIGSFVSKELEKVLTLVPLDEPTHTQEKFDDLLVIIQKFEMEYPEYKDERKEIYRLYIEKLVSAISIKLDAILASSAAEEKDLIQEKFDNLLVIIQNFKDEFPSCKDGYNELYQHYKKNIFRFYGMEYPSPAAEDEELVVETSAELPEAGDGCHGESCFAVESEPSSDMTDQSVSSALTMPSHSDSSPESSTSGSPPKPSVAGRAEDAAAVGVFGGLQKEIAKTTEKPIKLVSITTNGEQVTR